MTFKPYCHGSSIIYSIEKDPMFSCAACGRDQVGFLGFLFLVSMHSGTKPETLIRKGKRPGWSCKNCGEKGHRQKNCPKKLEKIDEGIGDVGESGNNENDNQEEDS